MVWVAVCLLLAPQLQAAKQPVDVAGVEFAGPGSSKVKLSGHPASTSDREIALRFGAQEGLAADEFSVLIDPDGDAFALPGTWAPAGNKLAFTPDVAGLEQLALELFEDVAGPAPGGEPTVELKPVSWKGKPKLKKGQPFFKLKLTLKGTVSTAQDEVGIKIILGGDLWVGPPGSGGPGGDPGDPDPQASPVADLSFLGNMQSSGKLKGYGKFKGVGTLVVDFGEQGGLAEDEFQLTIYDAPELGTTPDIYVLRGTWAVDKKHVVLSPVLADLEAVIEGLFWQELGGQLPEVSVDVVITSTDMTGKVKIDKQTGDPHLHPLNIGFAADLTVTGPGGVQAFSFCVTYKAKDAHIWNG